jgi:hypothetical protein
MFLSQPNLSQICLQYMFILRSVSLFSAGLFCAKIHFPKPINLLILFVSSRSPCFIYLEDLFAWSLDYFNSFI